MAYNNQIFTVRYRTPRGRWIDLPVPQFPDDAGFRAQISDPQQRPKWAKAFLDETYREYRQDDNRRRSDVSVDAIGERGADYFQACQPGVEERVVDRQTTIELLSCLSERSRHFVELRVVRGDRFSEIAQDMTAAGQPTSPDAVRKVVKRALEQLRKQHR